MMRQNQNVECRMRLLERGAVLTEGASYRYPVTFLMCLEFCLSVSSCSLFGVLFTRLSPLLFSPENHFSKLNLFRSLCSHGALSILSLTVCIVYVEPIFYFKCLAFLRDLEDGIKKLSRSKLGNHCVLRTP